MSEAVYGNSPGQIEVVSIDPHEMVEVPGFGIVHKSLVPGIDEWRASLAPEHRQIFDEIVAKTESLLAVEERDG